MNTSKIMKPSQTIAAALLAGAFGLLAAAPAAAQPVPSYAHGTMDETVQGTVSSINGPYSISVRDARGFIDNVSLHQGTIINPTGLSLEPGMPVTIIGHNDGSALSANEIDTPYQTLTAVPYYYPAYGFDYGVGLRFGHGFGFGFRGR